MMPPLRSERKENETPIKINPVKDIQTTENELVGQKKNSFEFFGPEQNSGVNLNVIKAEKEIDPITDYRHNNEKRVNNPDFGSAEWDTSQIEKVQYKYDPHLDPQLIWAGKA